MIVLGLLGDQGPRLRLVTQPDHAAFAADLLALFRRAEIAEHPRRDELLRAVRLHDNGWRELDAAPPVNPADGHPFDFLALPAALRGEVWERGTARYAQSDPYVALLVTEHALSLNRVNDRRNGWLERRRELLARCRLRLTTLRADYRFLDLADRLSLIACAGWHEPAERHGLTAELSAAGLALRPFPLAGATTFRIPCRWIEARRYAGESDLAGALAAARWESFSLRVLPG